MKKIVIIPLIISLVALAYFSFADNGEYKAWRDGWYSTGYQDGKNAERFDLEKNYSQHKETVITDEEETLISRNRHKAAEVYVKAAREGYQRGYKAGYYREKQAELLGVIEKSGQDIKVYDFKIGVMSPKGEPKVLKETDKIMLPKTEEGKSYFGFTFDYEGNYDSDRLVTVLALPSVPEKQLGAKYNPNTNSIVSEYTINYEKGSFSSRWFFRKGDLVGKFRLDIYIGGKLIKSIWFTSTEKSEIENDKK
jgi:hypothetical protein